MKHKFDKIYCINFLESKERREFQKKQFEYLGLDVEFFNAIDYGKIIKPHILKINRSELIEPRIFGCAMSHYSCIKQAQLLGYESVLILEDDVCFLKDVKLLEKYFNNLPKDWDYIKFVVVGVEEGKFDKKWIDLKSNYNTNVCASAYALNKKAIDLYCNNVENYQGLVPADLYLHFNFEINSSPLNSYMTNIPLVLPQVYLSDEKKNFTFLQPVWKYNYDDYYQPDEFLVSTLQENR